LKHCDEDDPLIAALFAADDINAPVE